MAVVYLGLGSNLGGRENNISLAMEQLKRRDIHIRKQSTIIETEPVGGPPQDKFLNAVVMAETSLTPFDLLKTIKDIETTLGRTKTIRNGPRTIDIDILLYQNVMINTSELAIPHPRMSQREFVMIPLKEIAPQLAEEFVHASH